MIGDLLQTIAAVAVLSVFAYWWWAKTEHEFFRDGESIDGHRFQRRKQATIIDPLLRAAWEESH